MYYCKSLPEAAEAAWSYARMNIPLDSSITVFILDGRKSIILESMEISARERISQLHDDFTPAKSYIMN